MCAIKDRLPNKSDKESASANLILWTSVKKAKHMCGGMESSSSFPASMQQQIMFIFKQKVQRTGQRKPIASNGAALPSGKKLKVLNHGWSSCMYIPHIDGTTYTQVFHLCVERERKAK